MTCPLLCNLIIPGAAKSGTSALHDILARHPNIEMSSQKEPHFFSIEAKYAQGPRSHNCLFKKSETVRFYGESSTGYMLSKRAIARISADIDNPKIIFLLRHPIDRSFSHYRWRYKLGLERRSFYDALNESGYGYDPEAPVKFGYESYIQFSQYADYCPLWVETFGAENCLFVRSETLRKWPLQSESRIYDFLGLPIPGPQLEILANETDSISRLPNRLEGKLYLLAPRVLRRSSVLKALWNTYINSTTPLPSSTMTSAERLFLEHELSDSIAYYESMAV